DVCSSDLRYESSVSSLLKCPDSSAREFNVLSYVTKNKLSIFMDSVVSTQSSPVKIYVEPSFATVLTSSLDFNNRSGGSPSLMAASAFKSYGAPSTDPSRSMSAS